MCFAPRKETRRKEKGDHYRRRPHELGDTAGRGDACVALRCRAVRTIIATRAGWHACVTIRWGTVRTTSAMRRVGAHACVGLVGTTRSNRMKHGHHRND